MFLAIWAFGFISAIQAIINLIRYLSWKNVPQCPGTILEQQEDGNYTEHSYTVSVEIDGSPLQCTYTRKKEDKNDTGAQVLRWKQPVDFLVKKEREIVILPEEREKIKHSLRRNCLIFGAAVALGAVFFVIAISTRH